MSEFDFSDSVRLSWKEGGGLRPASLFWLPKLSVHSCKMRKNVFPKYFVKSIPKPN